jgi:hypothetical protein
MSLFAQRQLQPGESEAVAQHKQRYYVGSSKRAGALFRQAGSSSIEGLSLFDRERENIEAVSSGAQLIFHLMI